MIISQAFGSVVVGHFQLGEVSEGGTRLPFQVVQQNSQLPGLADCVAIQIGCLCGDPHIDGFVVALEGALEIGPMAFGGIAVTRALFVAALHHSLQ